jgi:hypothetical protein
VKHLTADREVAEVSMATSGGSTAQIPEIPRAVGAFAAGLLAVFRERLNGVYLGGSYAMGDFTDSSDYDVLVVVEGDLSAGDLDALEALHERLDREDPDAQRLEVDYAPCHLLVPSGTTAPVPGVYDGRFQRDVAEIMLSADNLANMRCHGIAVYGAPASEILPDITLDDVRAAARQMALDGVGPCADEREASAELLNLARSLASMETGQPTTKTQGATWALAHLEDRWHPVVERALAVRRGAAVADSDRAVRDGLPELAALARIMANS